MNCIENSVQKKPKNRLIRLCVFLCTKSIFFPKHHNFANFSSFSSAQHARTWPQHAQCSTICPGKTAQVVLEIRENSTFCVIFFRVNLASNLASTNIPLNSLKNRLFLLSFQPRPALMASMSHDFLKKSCSKTHKESRAQKKAVSHAFCLMSTRTNFHLAQLPHLFALFATDTCQALAMPSPGPGCNLNKPNQKANV